MVSLEKSGGSGDEVAARFFVMADTPGFLAPLSEMLATLSPPVQPIWRALRQNLPGALSTLDIPLTLAFAGAKQERLHRLYLAGVFRAKAEIVGTKQDVDVKDLPEVYRNRAMDQAKQALQDELQSEGGIQGLTHAAVSVLSEALKNENVQAAADELLRQGLVLLWSSFEVLCRDLLVTFLNAKPHQVLKLVEMPTTRRFFNLRGLDLAGCGKIG